MDLTSPVTRLSQVGENTAGKLKKLGISTLFDLLYHLPFRYEDRTLVSPVSRLQPGETVTVIGTIDQLKNEYTKGRKFIQSGQFSDTSGTIHITWFNQPFLTRTLKSGTPVALYGKVDLFKNQPSLISPDYELPTPNHELIHMARLVPVYPETAGISSKWLRARIFSLLKSLDIPEIFPAPGFLPWMQALWQVHFPSDQALAQAARRRLAFDELFLLQLTSLRRRLSWKQVRLFHRFRVDQKQVLGFISSLPFSLTPSQSQAIREILSDLSSPHPMNRLLEGDVGSGKTVVAAVAALVAHLNGFQSLLLAPTQILAQQHFQTLETLFGPYGISIGLITGASKFKIGREAGLQRNPNLQFKILVGTHALLTEKVPPDRVGLVVIDEQHRFGVLQRGKASALGISPHILTMTATPIPRTIALTLYGDLDLSLLTDQPSGRLPVKTWVVPETKRADAYNWIKSQITGSNSQAFIICPFIESSETLTSVKAAAAEFTKLEKIFPRLKLGLLHGKLKSRQKDEVISRFRAGDYQILVSTPIVEVGIDIPSATIMLIEAAERFGLAQLHQLRGRVGRSHRQSYCLLFASSPTARLKAMEQHFSGLKLAEIDLQLRGPGQIYGTAQHGLPQFKVASFEDLDLIEKAKPSAAQILPRLDQYPLLRDLVKEDKIDLIQPN